MKTTLLAIIAAATLTGCATTSTRTYHIDGRTITIECREEAAILNDRSIQQHRKNMNGVVRGLHTSVGMNTRIIVPWSGDSDINGNPLPDFEVLGHEIWHCPELGGLFHN